ncbi:MAG: polysaccharide deacetylase family protein [Acidobacteria bacterium]|nr:polysaccharide deacetylase family protein [Acidobacteriota bacterium]
MKLAIKIMSSTVFLAFLIVLFLILYFGVPKNRALFIESVDKIDTNKKIVYLTFDDGPSPDITPAVLDLLAEYNAKATFFMTGMKMEKYPELVKRVIDEGHAFGHHSYAHKRMILKTYGYIQNDIEKMDRLFEEFTGEKVVLYRPPWGAKFIMLPKVLRDTNKKLIMWSAESPSQYNRENLNGEWIAAETLEEVKPGSIVLLHDGWTGTHGEIAKAVAIILDKLTEKGYRFNRIE